MESILIFAVDKLEYVIAVGGGLGIGLYMATRKARNNDNDLTQRIIKLKRYTNSVNQRTKTM